MCAAALLGYRALGAAGALLVSSPQMAYEEEDVELAPPLEEEEEEPALVQQLGGAKAIHNIVRLIEQQRSDQFTKRRVADEAASEGIALPLEAGSLLLGAIALVGGLGVR